MVTLFLRQGETGKQVLLSFPVTTPAEKEDVTATMEKLRSISRTVTIQGAASEVMNLGQHLRGIDLAAEGELERINQLAERLEHMSEVDCDKFAGMLDANKISGTKDILQLTEHLDDYVILPGCSSAPSIGKYLMDCGVAPTLKQLCKNIDYEAVGQIFLDAHSGAACSRGFVVRNEHLPRAVLKDLHIEPQQEAHMNTQIRYLYRDASNYKVENECVVTGTFTPEQIAQIMDLCNFLPDMELKGHRIMISDVNRPALQLSGYFKHFEQSRVQIIGTVEYTYLQQLDEEKREKIYSEFMGYDIPCVIFCRDLRPDDSFLKIAEEKNIPVLGTKRSTSEFMAELIYCLNEQLAPCITIHGVLVDVYGE